MDAALVAKAREAVKACELEGYICHHDLTIYKKLITMYLDGMVGKEFDSLIFIGNSLEVASHIINLGTSRRTHLIGIEWVQKAYRDAVPPPRPSHVLAALVLIYLMASTETEKGGLALLQAEDEVNKILPEKQVDAKEVWQRIREIIEGALNPPAAKAQGG
jgi:hypothetical protein